MEDALEACHKYIDALCWAFKPQTKIKSSSDNLLLILIPGASDEIKEEIKDLEKLQSRQYRSKGLLSLVASVLLDLMPPSARCSKAWQCLTRFATRPPSGRENRLSKRGSSLLLAYLDQSQQDSGYVGDSSEQDPLLELAKLCRHSSELVLVMSTREDDAHQLLFSDKGPDRIQPFVEKFKESVKLADTFLRLLSPSAKEADLDKLLEPDGFCKTFCDILGRGYVCVYGGWRHVFIPSPLLSF